MPLLAMAYVVTGEKAYLEAARQWSLASCGYKTWGLGRIDGMDLAAGHQLYGLALVYDWCHRDLDDEVRQTIRQTLVRRASAMYTGRGDGLGLVEPVVPFSRHSPPATPSGFNGC